MHKLKIIQRKKTVDEYHSWIWMQKFWTKIPNPAGIEENLLNGVFIEVCKF